MAAPVRDLQTLLLKLVRGLRWASYGFILLLLAWIVVQVADVTRLLSGVHPALGLAFLAACIAAFGFLVVRPLVRFLEMPVVVRPPALPPPGERRPRDLVRHLAFVERYVEALGRNPSWTGSEDERREALDLCRALRERASRGDAGEVERLAKPVAELEKERVARLLAPLDRQASDVIRQEAMRIGIATAVSPYGRLDAFLVLWRSMNLVARIARIYYGRPGARGTLGILRDVSMATLASAYLEDLSEIAGDMVATFVGRTAGAFAGPLLDGSLNAVAVLRIGYVTKARCRAFAAWTGRTRAEAVRGALLEAASLSRGVVTDVVRTVGGGLLRLPARVLGSIVDRVGGLFRRGEGGAPRTEGA